MVRRRAVLVVGAVSLLVATGALSASPVSATPSGVAGPDAPVATNTAGTRYLDPIFAGSLAPKVEASYDPSIPLNREQLVTVRAVAGTFSLSVGGSTTPALPFDAPAANVQAALQALPTVNLDGVAGNDVTVTGGGGGPFGGLHYRVRLNDNAPPGTTLPKVVGNDVSLTSPIGHSVVTQCVRCLDVLQPQESPVPVGGRPVVVVIHGGGWVGGSKDGSSGDANGMFAEQWATELASRGYVAVSINYTLADPDPLAAFSQCEWDPPQALGPPCPPEIAATVHAAQYDTQAAVRWLRSTVTAGNPYRIKSSRIVTFGASAGATAALDTLYRPDDPGTVGITTGDSSVSAAVALAGFTNSTYQRAGAGPALLMSYTNDVMGELFGFDLYDAGRELVARANAVGTTTELASYCQRVDANGDGTVEPVHVPTPPQAAYRDQVNRATTWLYQRVVGTIVHKKPFPALWTGNAGTSPLVAQSGQVLVEGSHQTLRGDFDGDGNDDLFFYAPGSGCDTVWFGRADGTFEDPREFAPGSGFVPAAEVDGDFVPLVADMDSDGIDDVLFYYPATGQDSELWFGRASRVFAKAKGSLPKGLQWFAGDFDADGRTDLGIASGSYWAIGFGQGGFNFLWDFDHVRSAPGARVVGDVDGDGHDDLVFAGATVTVFHGGAHGGDAAFSSVDLGPPPGTSAPVVGDFDGDGRDDLLWHDPGGVSATVWYGQAAGTQSVTVPLSTPNAIASVGDFEGNGRTDVLWYDPAGSAHVWRGTTDRVVEPFKDVTPSGSVEPGRVPVVGNFNGDSTKGGFGRDDVYWSVG